MQNYQRVVLFDERGGSTNVEAMGIDDKEKEVRLLDTDLFQQASI